MSDSRTVTVRMDGDLYRVLKEVASTWDVSKSEVIREGVREVAASEEEAPTWAKTIARREQMKVEHKDDQYKKYFKKNVREKFKSDFEDHIPAWGHEGTREHFLEEAEALFGDEPERLAEMKAHVNKWADEAIASREQQEGFDLDDPTEVFGKYEGVERGVAREEAEDDLDDMVDDAVRRLSSASVVDRDAVATSLANAYGVRDELAEDAVGEALRRLRGDADGSGGETA